MKPDLPGALRPERPSPRALACEAHRGPSGATSPNGVLAARTVQAPGAVSSAPRARPRSQSTAQGEMAPSTLQVNPLCRKHLEHTAMPLAACSPQVSSNLA